MGIRVFSGLTRPGSIQQAPGISGQTFGANVHQSLTSGSRPYSRKIHLLLLGFSTGEPSAAV